MVFLYFSIGLVYKSLLCSASFRDVLHKHFGHLQGILLLSDRIPLTSLGGLVCCGETTIAIYSVLV